MSEYQYHKWRAVDRVLTQKYSTRPSLIDRWKNRGWV